MTTSENGFGSRAGNNLREALSSICLKKGHGEKKKNGTTEVHVPSIDYHRLAIRAGSERANTGCAHVCVFTLAKSKQSTFNVLAPVAGPTHNLI